MKLFATAILLGASVMGAQSTTVEVLNSIPVTQATAGLGFNIAPQQYKNAANFAQAAAAGAKWVRIQASWANTEIQSAPPNNTSSGYAIGSGTSEDVLDALAAAKANGLNVTVVAAYGPPKHETMAVSLTSAAAVGATTLNVQLEQAVNGSTLSGITTAGTTYVSSAGLNSSGVPAATLSGSLGLSAAEDIAGTYITGVSCSDSTHCALTLASALTVALPSTPGGSPLTGCSMAANSTSVTCTGANLPPPVTTTVNGKSVTTPSVQSGQDTSITIPGAGANGGNLVTTIGTVTSATTFTVAKSSQTAVSGVTATETFQIGIYDRLYAPLKTQTANDPSAVAYGNYVAFLASYMNQQGITGNVEVWNERNSRDNWINYCALYDVNPCPTTQTAGVQVNGDPGFAFIANLQARTFPAGVTVTWDGTWADGNLGLLDYYSSKSPYTVAIGTALPQPQSVVRGQAVHPYGGPYGNPEDTMGAAACLASYAQSAGTPVSNPGCYLAGERNTTNGGSNLFGLNTVLDYQQSVNPAYGIPTIATETSVSPVGAGGLTALAKFNARQFLGFEAMGITPIEFFELWDGSTSSLSDASFTNASASNFSFMVSDGTNFTPTPAYTALQGIQTDLAPLASTATGTLNPPTVANYSGTYNLTTMTMYGQRTGASAPSYVHVSWQRTVCTNALNCWPVLASPSAGTEVVNLPTGTSVTSLTDTVTRQAVAYTVANGQATFSVVDDPIELIADPVTAAASTLFTGLHGIRGVRGAHF